MVSSEPASCQAARCGEQRAYTCNHVHVHYQGVVSRKPTSVIMVPVRYQGVVSRKLASVITVHVS